LTGKLNQVAQQLKSNNTWLDKTIDTVYKSISNIDTLQLPLDVPGGPYDTTRKKPDRKTIQEFYEELDYPFFSSVTKEPILALAKLQLDVWVDHINHKMIIILKSQKIGISSLCIIITLWHALTDCMGMELIINAQTDDQAKTHAQDLRRIIKGSAKYHDYLIDTAFTGLGLLKDEITKVHTIYLHNPLKPTTPTKIIVVGMSPGALLSHKRVGFIWSSDFTISQLTAAKKEEVWGAMLSRRANTEGPVIIEAPARDPSGPIYEAYERYERQLVDKEFIDPNQDFFVFKYTYELGLRDGFFTPEFIESEQRRLGPLFGTFYKADFFASGHTWYKKNQLENITDDATDLFFEFNPKDDFQSDVSDD
jgi:hypothetical protein